MRRAGLLCALVALGFALAAGPASAAAPRLTEAGGVRFPNRAYALTLGAPRPLNKNQIEVRENGHPVAGVNIVPAEQSGRHSFGVVLALDTSGSMAGRPLEAARAFVRHRRPDQPVAVITFAGDVRVLQPFTTDGAAIERALSSVSPGSGGSHILDATAKAVGMISAAGMTSGSAVVLSDGKDYGSHATLAQVGGAARAVGARVYSVGVRARGTDFGTLNLLAAATGGEFSSVSSLNDLARVYDRLGSQLGHQYLIRYRSETPPGRRVDVDVRVKGVAATASTVYATPQLAHEPGAPFRRSPAAALWAVPSVSLLVIALAAVLVALAAWALVRPRTGSLRERMAAFVAPPAEDDGDGTGQLSGRLLQGAERSLEQREWWTGFKERMDVGRIEMPPVRLVTWTVAATLLVFVLLLLLFGNPVFALPALVVPLGAKLFVDRRATRQRKLFADQLPDNLQVIASAMRAGHSFAGALSVVVEDAPEPTRRELERVVADEGLGVPLETALGVVVRRMESKDLEQVALVASLQRDTGGNTAEVLDRVTETVRERMGLMRMVNSLTAQGRMSRWILTALPCFLLAAITVMNPTYVQPLYESTIGRVLLGVSAAMVCAGSFVIARIVDIKV
jgi:tight adherence protein B